MDYATDVTQQVLQSTLDEIKSATSLEQLDPCVICLEEVSEKAQAVPCSHQNFDFLCLASWVENNPQCPLCKRAVEAINYDQKSSTDYKTYKVKKISVADVKPRPSNTSLLRTHRPRRFRSPPAPSSPSLEGALQRRREVYRKSLYSCHVGSNRLSRFQDLTPARFSEDEHLLSRARTFIRRELRVFDFLDPDKPSHGQPVRRANNAEFLLEYIVAILKTVDIKGSGGQAEDMLQEFLGRSNTRLFLHELRAWLRSPYDLLSTWDRHVQYNEGSFRSPEDNDLPVHDSKGDLERRFTQDQVRKRKLSSAERGTFRGDFYRPDPSTPTRPKRRNGET